MFSHILKPVVMHGGLHMLSSKNFGGFWWEIQGVLEGFYSWQRIGH